MGSQVILITGCSSGMGKDLAIGLAKTGYTIVATARCLETIENLNVALKLQVDVTCIESIRTAVDEVIRCFGKIDILINNAGYAIRGAVEELSDEEIRKMFDVNVYGALRMIRAIVPHMRERGYGKIVNIGSIAGKMVLPVSGAYCASKFALEAFSDAFRLELNSFGIAVVLIEAGNIQTNFMDTVHKNSDSIISNPHSVYRQLYQNYIKFDLKARHNNPGPEAVTKVVQGVLKDTKPQARYFVGIPVKNYFISKLSDSLKDIIVKALFKN